MLLDDVADLISTGGYGTLGTNLFKGMLPSDPDEAVAVIHYGGLEPVRAPNATDSGLMHPDVLSHEARTPMRALIRWRLVQRGVNDLGFPLPRNRLRPARPRSVGREPGRAAGVVSI